MSDSSGLWRMKVGMFPLLSAVLMSSACANLRDGQHEVIYVPTAKGMEAQRVNVGPPVANDSAKGNSDGPHVVDREAQQDDVRAALLADSQYLDYIGQVSVPLFIVGSRLQALIGSKRVDDYDTGDSICHIWAQHVEERVSAGNLTSCTDYLVEAEKFRERKWQSLGVDFHSLTYGFLRLREWCGGDVGGRPLPCEVPPLQDSGPGLLEAPLCVAVVAQLFRTRNGRQFGLIEGTDPKVYGSRRAIRIISDSDSSIQEFSKDFSKLGTRESCAGFFEGNL